MASEIMQQYLTARQQADAYAHNGQIAEAVAHYDQAIELVPQAGFSQSQQQLLLPLLRRRRERVAAGDVL